MAQQDTKVNTIPDDLMTPAEAVALLGYSPITRSGVYVQLKRLRGRGLKVYQLSGSRLRISKADVADFLASIRI